MNGGESVKADREEEKMRMRRRKNCIGRHAQYQTHTHAYTEGESVYVWTSVESNSLLCIRRVSPTHIFAQPILAAYVYACFTHSVSLLQNRATGVFFLILLGSFASLTHSFALSLFSVVYWHIFPYCVCVCVMVRYKMIGTVVKNAHVS